MHEYSILIATDAQCSFLEQEGGESTNAAKESVPLIAHLDVKIIDQTAQDKKAELSAVLYYVKDYQSKTYFAQDIFAERARKIFGAACK